MLRKILNVEFPIHCYADANMMPIVMGDDDSIPLNLRQYAPMVNTCKFLKGSTVYLSVQESMVLTGETQRRPGAHTDGTSATGWGGGWGGGVPVKPTKPREPTKGIYTASTNGLCRIWDTITYDVDDHGATLNPLLVDSIVTEPNVLYWMTDRTPHESLPQTEDHPRQWFRLVAEEIGVWYAQHSTPNPLGVEPKAPIEYGSKFV